MDSLASVAFFEIEAVYDFQKNHTHAKNIDVLIASKLNIVMKAVAPESLRFLIVQRYHISDAHYVK